MRRVHILALRFPNNICFEYYKLLANILLLSLQITLSWLISIYKKEPSKFQCAYESPGYFDEIAYSGSLVL